VLKAAYSKLESECQLCRKIAANTMRKSLVAFQLKAVILIGVFLELITILILLCAIFSEVVASHEDLINSTRVDFN